MYSQYINYMAIIIQLHHQRNTPKSWAAKSPLNSLPRKWKNIVFWGGESETYACDITRNLWAATRVSLLGAVKISNNFTPNGVVTWQALIDTRNKNSLQQLVAPTAGPNEGVGWRVLWYRGGCTYKSYNLFLICRRPHFCLDEILQSYDCKLTKRYMIYFSVFRVFLLQSIPSRGRVTFILSSHCDIDFLRFCWIKVGTLPIKSVDFEQQNQDVKLFHMY